MSVLPAELWTNIFRLCDTKDVLGATRINKVVGAEAERALFDVVVLEHIVRVLLLLRGLKTAHPDRRDRRLRSVRRLYILFGGQRQGQLVPQWPPLVYPNRRAILRAISSFIISLPALTQLTIRLPSRNDCELFDPLVLLKGQFKLTTLCLTVPYTRDLAQFLASQSQSLTSLVLHPPEWATSPSHWIRYKKAPRLPHLVAFDSVEALAGQWHGVEKLRLLNDKPLDPRYSIWTGHTLEKMHHLAPFANTLLVLRLSGHGYPNLVQRVAEMVPMLRGLTIDLIGLPSMMHGTPWDDDAWANAFEGMQALVNFHLSLPSMRRRMSHPWDALKPTALTMWHSACPSLRAVRFPGDEKRWLWDKRRGVWNAPS